jgi:hypothetical protein
MMPGLTVSERCANFAPTWILETFRSFCFRPVPVKRARIEGVHAGADDYLIKPFSARELAGPESSRI